MLLLIFYLGWLVNIDIFIYAGFGGVGVELGRRFWGFTVRGRVEICWGCFGLGLGLGPGGF